MKLTLLGGQGWTKTLLQEYTNPPKTQTSFVSCFLLGGTRHIYSKRFQLGPRFSWRLGWVALPSQRGKPGVLNFEANRFPNVGTVCNTRAPHKATAPDGTFKIHTPLFSRRKTTTMWHMWGTFKQPHTAVPRKKTSPLGVASSVGPSRAFPQVEHP